MGGLAVGGVCLLTRPDGSLCVHGGMVNAGSAGVDSTAHACERAVFRLRPVSL